MSDFITMSCPNCGGRLEVSPSTLTLMCQNCGIEHMVKREAGNIMLESFARCPICNRNDRVEKVSGIYKQETGDLRAKLEPPPQPQVALLYNPHSCITFGCSYFIFASIISEIGGYIILGFRGYETIFIIFIIFLNILVILVSIFFATFVKKFVSSKNIRRQAIFEAEGHLEQWRKAITKWESLYYCRRDDCVFNPTTKVVVSVDKITELTKL